VLKPDRNGAALAKVHQIDVKHGEQMTTLQIRPVILAALCAASLLSPTCVFAQGNNQYAQIKQQQNAKAAPFEQLRDAPTSLPYMAQIAPPGGKLISAMKDKKGKGRMTLILRYGIVDTPANTIRYYADSLRNSKWKIGMQKGEQLLASYKDSNVVVSIYPASRKEYKNDVQLTYQMAAE
jgi:hypothetical protein